ncbi:cell division ATP-binding protein FtsE [candidate division WWE3 bacterium RIFOXYC1_FULL_39_7]|uniref:Cell division ATP-binding protein FtsE n=2 Tax=Katanobacteria TaxID=422282 RepID=A0A1F4X984_UNCKA|nr:MAG: cell division ATP-binding protein FtsE [candidate division WWE3 bacterium RIFOXYC1_FULL_39_7]OGC78236.1 MAG: cell division ATP-binding protein FtsE [candidate division WWE3 bacterium RIFOXYD1_FULL_39_9]
MPQIEFINVSKEYEHGSVALDNVSFQIDPGEFVFVVGPSGAGKSTIVKLLIREEFPNSGQILVNDEDVSMIPQEHVHDYRRKIGVVFQDFKLLESRNIFENVAIALEVTDANDHEIKNVIPNVLNMVGLSSKMFMYPRQLSGGEKQRVSIARALAHEPDILVADEATGMIDPDSSDTVVEILEKVNSLGTTILMATHDQKIVDKLKKRVIRIETGKIVSDKKGGKYRG